MPFRDVTVGALLSRLAVAYPDRDALVYSHAGRRSTFCQHDEEARLVARGLNAHGIGRGDRVAVRAANVRDWIILQFALAKLGAILVTVNTSLRAAEIEYLLRRNETSTLVTVRRFRGVGYLQDLRRLCVPLFHCFGCVIGVLGASTHAACICAVESFDARGPRNRRARARRGAQWQRRDARTARRERCWPMSLPRGAAG